MAKLGLHSSIFLLVARADGFISGAIFLRATTRSWLRSLSSTRSLIDPQTKEVEIQSLHSRDKVDAFAELDTPVGLAKGVGTIPKLMTEKPEHFMRKQGIDPARKPSNGYRDLRDAHASQHLQHGNGLNNKNTSNFDSNCIVVEEVPSAVTDSQLKDAVSIFGEASYVSMKMVPNGPSCCIVKFKNLRSYRRAVSVNEILVGSLHLPIHPLQSAAFRITHIGSEAGDSEIHSRCMLYGHLEGMLRTEEGNMDVFFMVKDDMDTQSILDKLNSTIINDHRWSAHLQPTRVDQRHEDGSGNVRCNLGQEITSCLADLKVKYSIKKLCAADLEYLHSCIMHLEARPEKN